MTTTTRAIYEQLQDTLRTGLADMLGPELIYLIADPTIDQRNELVVQIVPGVPQSQHAESGVGLISEEFDIVVWFQSYADEGVVDTQKLIDSTWSVLKIISTIRQTLIMDTLGNTAAVPVKFRRGSRPTRSLDNYGWIQMTDTYEVGYEIDWS